jgi:hypothetical protein
MKKLCLVQMLAWCAWFTFVPIASEYFTEKVCSLSRFLVCFFLQGLLGKI